MQAGRASLLAGMCPAVSRGAGRTSRAARCGMTVSCGAMGREATADRLGGPPQPARLRADAKGVWMPLRARKHSTSHLQPTWATARIFCRRRRPREGLSRNFPAPTHLDADSCTEFLYTYCRLHGPSCGMARNRAVSGGSVGGIGRKTERKSHRRRAGGGLPHPLLRQRLVSDSPASPRGLLPPLAAPGAWPRLRPAPAAGPPQPVSAHFGLLARPVAAAGAGAR